MKKFTEIFQSFRSEWQKGPEILFFSGLVLFLTHTQILDINWKNEFLIRIGAAILDLSAIICVLFFALVLVMWKKHAITFLLAVAAAVLIMMWWPGQSYYIRSTVAGIFLILMADTRNYRKILKCYFFVNLTGFLTAMLGLAFHFTEDLAKTEVYGVGHSCGYIHPNNAAFYLFLMLMLAWYLWLRKKDGITLLLFWLMTIPVWFYMKCRTIVILMAFFPVLVLICHQFEKDEKRVSSMLKNKVWNICMLAAPFLYFALSLILTRFMEPLTATFEKTPMWNMASRFVQGGIALSYYGITLLGHSIDTSGYVGMELAGYMEPLLYLDNAYLSELVFRGLIGVTLELVYLSAVNWKCIRAKDLALLTIANVMLLFGLMEHYTMFPAYNFTLICLFAEMKASVRTVPEQEMAS